MQAIDSQLNFSNRQTAVVRIGGATRTPPIADAVFDTLSGLAPLTVNIDMTGIQVLPADLYPPVRLLLKPTLVRERTPSHTWIFS